MNKINLENRVAIVTGGAQGFGLAITKRFIESGARVLIWDKDKEYLNKVDLKNTQKIEVDVSNICFSVNISFITMPSGNFEE